MTDALPIAVLTGFLGSGKTTFLRRVLAAPAMAETAVVINEFGDVGLDHLLVEASPDEVMLLPSGCLCCAVRQDLVRTLYRLLARRAEGAIPPFRRIVVETSGLAEPAPILYTLAADAHLERALRFAAVLTLVDAVAGLATLDRYAEATAQAVVADRLLVSKTDIVPPAPALLDRLAALNPTAEIGDARAAIDPGQALFGAVPHAGPRRTLFAAPATHTHGIASFAILLRQPISRLDVRQGARRAGARPGRRPVAGEGDRRVRRHRPARRDPCGAAHPVSARVARRLARRRMPEPPGVHHPRHHARRGNGALRGGRPGVVRLKRKAGRH